MGKIADPKSLRARLSTLSQLEAGWLDGEGSPVSKKAIDVADDIISLFPELSNMVDVFPTLEGGVSIESIGAPFFYLEVDPEGVVEVTDMTRSEQNPTVETYDPLAQNGKMNRPFNVRIHGMIEQSRRMSSATGRGQNGPSGREGRLDGLLRSILPSLNFTTLPDRTREAVMREFVELRAAGKNQFSHIDFEVTEELFYFDELIMANISSDIGEGLVMRVPEDLTGHMYVLAFPGERFMSELKSGKVDVRTVMLDVACPIHTSEGLVYEDGKIRGIATPMRGYLSEDFLPEEGLFLTDTSPEIEGCGAS
ncbi:hypothetical protein [Pseudosulfitobacter pseudonitzschiae]|uniref:hypothetical protein n=1 Tax=Pseudosulfitobacter pseudonitzschiae TaxID=1402135 RepID=UPI003B812DC6